MVVIEETQSYPIVGEDKQDERREKLIETIRVKFLRIARRLAQMPCDLVVAQVLYRLGLLDPLMAMHHNQEYGSTSTNNIIDRANLMAEQLEAAAAPLDFSCTILVLGKTGVGKTATINSIFDTEEKKLATSAFERCTREVREVMGTIQGIKIRVIDTPGLLPCLSEQHHNKRILTSVKQFIKKTPPDVVLYVDRLDLPSNTGSSDGTLLRDITDVLGASIWSNKAIIVLTHAAASARSDGPNGSASSYDMLVTRQSNAVQQAVGEAAGDMRLTVPVSLVENNHHHCVSTNGRRAAILMKKNMWRPHLLLLSFASKILVEATTSTLLLSSKLQDAPKRPPYAFRIRAYPLGYLYQCLYKPVSHDLYQQSVYRPFETYLGTYDFYRWQLDAIPEEPDRENDLAVGGIQIRKNYVANRNVRGWLHSQVLKDKKHAFVHMETVTEIKHGRGRETSVMYDVDYVKTTKGKQRLWYSGGRWKDVSGCKLTTDTRVMNHGRHKTNAGLLFSVDAGNAVVAGVGIRDEITAAKDQFQMLVSGCAVTNPNDAIAFCGYLSALYKWSSSCLVRLWLRFVPGETRTLEDCCAVGSLIPMGRNSVMQLDVLNRSIYMIWRTADYPELALLLFIPRVRWFLRRAKRELVMLGWW